MLFFIRSLRLNPILIAKAGDVRFHDTVKGARCVSYVFYTYPGSDELQVGIVQCWGGDVRLIQHSRQNNGRKNLFIASYKLKAEQIKYDVLTNTAAPYVARGIFVF